MMNKPMSYNYNESNGVVSSALSVISQKSGFPFTAFGEQTRAGWASSDGIPAVAATWWADGVRVTEQFSGLVGKNTFRREISLCGANIHGDEQYRLRLNLPAAKRP